VKNLKREMSENRKRIVIGTGFAIALAAFWQLISTKDNRTKHLDWTSFSLEAAILIMVGFILYWREKSN
jgi:hypothetical protein